MSIAWNQTLATGSPEIDTEHKELFQRINKLLAAQQMGSIGWNEMSRLIRFLTDYVVFHFGHEEMLMDRSGYTSAAGHKAQHAQFVKVFLRLKERLLSEGPLPELQQDTRDLLVDWLMNHIRYSDRALGVFLRLKSHPAWSVQHAGRRDERVAERPPA